MRVTLYAKEDCELCDQAKADLISLQAEIPHQLIEIDIQADPLLLERFGMHVPVVEIGPYTLTAPFSQTDLQVSLKAAADSRPAVAADRDHTWRLRLNRGLLAFARHWLAVFNLIVFSYAALPFTAPVLMKAGATSAADAIYTLYSPFCHQLGFRSWFLFGEQAAYPTERAGSAGQSFAEATGLSEEDYLSAREYRGNERVGYKVALCQRDIGTYGGIFLAGLAYSFLKGRVKPLPLKYWFLIGVLPIAIDGGTQLLSVFPWLPIPARESTPMLRTLTGMLFGIMNVWMAYPFIEESMQETEKAIATKLAIAKQRDSQLTAGRW